MVIYTNALKHISFVEYYLQIIRWENRINNLLSNVCWVTAPNTTMTLIQTNIKTNKKKTKIVVLLRDIKASYDVSLDKYT